VLAGVVAILAVRAGAINCVAGLIYRQKVVLVGGFALNRPGHLGLSFQSVGNRVVCVSLVRLRVSPRL